MYNQSQRLCKCQTGFTWTCLTHNTSCSVYCQGGTQGGGCGYTNTQPPKLKHQCTRCSCSVANPATPPTLVSPANASVVTNDNFQARRKYFVGCCHGYKDGNNNRAQMEFPCAACVTPSHSIDFTTERVGQNPEGAGF